ncbi:cysteine--tRNA ligase, partial [Candidatus Parcubacteria bacterium]
MKIYLENTLGRKKEEFKPIHNGNVGMYVCGPTVYQRASIGNFRAFIFADLLRRMLEFNGLNVKMVMNITDVGHLTDDASDGEDKVEKQAEKTGQSAWDISKKYTELFLRDLVDLNIT